MYTKLRCVHVFEPGTDDHSSQLVTAGSWEAPEEAGPPLAAPTPAARRRRSSWGGRGEGVGVGTVGVGGGEVVVAM